MWNCSHTTWTPEVLHDIVKTGNHYMIHGRKYYRVTNILNVISKPQLETWKRIKGYRKSQEIMRARGDFGTLFHKLAELLVNGIDVDMTGYSDEMCEGVKLFSNWLIDSNVVLEQSEQVLRSKVFGYAGTTDVVCMRDGKRFIGDWKTSKYIYDSYWLQLAAYTNAFIETYDACIDGAFIVRCRDGVIEEQVRTLDELKDDFEIFSAVLRVYDWQISSGGK